ncbi:hypothetical protein [Hugenholtzia roseola]|uniref:hypothetical protein n=1 Tax=Hugenholtzia roseola TaxID=1002 RepID=UPI000403B09E|nr:hypothetical protein [Hugenholtzia roseola]
MKKTNWIFALMFAFVLSFSLTSCDDLFDCEDDDYKECKDDRNCGDSNDGCNDDNNSCDDNDDKNYRVRYFHNTTPQTNDKGAPFKILGYEKRGDDLRVRVQYAGGCGDHDFEVFWDGEVRRGNPQTSLIVLHRSNDACEALIERTIEIDLEEAFRRDDPRYSVEVVNGNTAERFFTKE